LDAAGCEDVKDSALRVFRSRVFANSSTGTRASNLKTWVEFHTAWFELVLQVGLVQTSLARTVLTTCERVSRMRNSDAISYQFCSGGVTLLGRGCVQCHQGVRRFPPCALSLGAAARGMAYDWKIALTAWLASFVYGEVSAQAV